MKKKLLALMIACVMPMTLFADDVTTGNAGTMSVQPAASASTTTTTTTTTTSTAPATAASQMSMPTKMSSEAEMLQQYNDYYHAHFISIPEMNDDLKKRMDVIYNDLKNCNSSVNMLAIPTPMQLFAVSINIAGLKENLCDIQVTITATQNTPGGNLNCKIAPDKLMTLKDAFTQFSDSVSHSVLQKMAGDSNATKPDMNSLKIIQDIMQKNCIMKMDTPAK